MKTKSSSKRKFKQLSNVQHVRMRTGMWLGQNSYSTHMQHFINPIPNKESPDLITHREVTEIPAKMKCLDEACMNAVDEYHRNLKDKNIKSKSKMNLLKVTLSDDKRRIGVMDNGRGIPAENAEDVFLHLMYGENFDDEAKEHISGQNGVGISLVRIVSSHFKVITHTRKNVYKKIFTMPAEFKQFLKDTLHPTSSLIQKIHHHLDEHGHLKTFKGLSPSQKKQIQGAMKTHHMNAHITSNPKQTHGTFIEYQLNPVYFNHCDIAYNPLLVCQYLQDLAMTTPGLRILYQHQNQSHEFLFKKGIEDVLKSSTLAYYPLKYQSPDERFIMKSYIIQGKGTSLHWVNATFVSLGGSAIETLENRICDDTRKKYAITAYEKKLNAQATRNDVRECFHMINIFSMQHPRFKSQDKSYLINDLNKYIREAVQQHLDRLIRKIDLITLVKQHMQKRNALKSFDQSMKIFKQKGKAIIPKLIPLNHPPPKAQTILFIAEGDSAIAGLRPVRNPRLHALFPLKGKPLNVKGLPIYKTLENNEMRNIITAINLPIDHKVSSLSSLKYSKISIITDADYDGYAIRSLVFNFFLEYWPELYDLGFIHMSESPLYEVDILNPKKKKKPSSVKTKMNSTFS